MDKSVQKRPLAITAFLTLIFTVPFSLGSGVYILLYSFVMLVVFPIYFLFVTRNKTSSQLLALKRHYPLAFYSLVLFFVSTIVTHSLLLLSDASLEQKVFSTFTYLQYVLIVFFCFMLARVYALKYLSPHLMFMLIAYGCVFTAVLFALIYLDGAPNVESWPREPPIGTNLRVFGIILSATTVSCVVMLFFDKADKYKVALCSLSLLVSCAFLVWTASRINIAAVAVTLLLLIYFSSKWQAVSKKRMFAVITLIAISIPIGDYLSIKPWGGLGRVSYSVNKVQQGETLSESLNAVGSGRIVVWKAAIDTIVEKPLMGHSAYGFYFSKHRQACCYEEREHNVFLHFLLEWGAVGASFFIIFLGTVFIHIAKHLKMAITLRDVNWLTASSVVFVISIASVANRAYEFILAIFLLACAYAYAPLRIPQQKIK